MTRYVLCFACLFLGVGTGLAQVKDARAAETPAVRTLQDARRQGWQGALLILGALENSDAKSFPGIRAFAEDFRSVERVVNARTTADRLPSVDADVMLTRNPNFWRAFYETAVADPAFLYLYSGLLMTGGEAHRAAYVLILARQRPGVPKDVRRNDQLLLDQALAVIEEGDRAVQAGIKVFDTGDLDSAARTYREALAWWPQNSWAEYELGFTVRTRDETRTAGTSHKGASPWSPEALDHFAAARHHDPLRWEAYQGNDRDMTEAMLNLKRRVLPAWDRIKTDAAVDDDVLLRFAEGCQSAGIHDLALVARQVVVARRGRYSPADHPFISTSLRKVAPGDRAELTLKRLAGEKLQLRQLVKPEASPNP